MTMAEFPATPIEANVQTENNNDLKVMQDNYRK